MVLRINGLKQFRQNVVTEKLSITVNGYFFSLQYYCSICSQCGSTYTYSQTKNGCGTICSSIISFPPYLTFFYGTALSVFIGFFNVRFRLRNRIYSSNDCIYFTTDLISHVFPQKESLH